MKARCFWLVLVRPRLGFDRLLKVDEFKIVCGADGSAA
jgi:hypothetical protein